MNTPLHCLLLQTPGELLEGEKDFLRLGYAVEAFPSMQDASCMDDAEPEELPLHAYAPGWRHGDLPEVRSLRASLARMLADPRWQKEDFPDRQDPKHGAYGHDADALMMPLVRHS